MPIMHSSQSGTLERSAMTGAETTRATGDAVWSGDRAIRALAGGVVLAVAAFAAIVSYTHIYDLGRAHGQAGTAARLLPLSVDGLIVAASLVMLLEARAGRAAPPLARVMLCVGQVQIHRDNGRSRRGAAVGAARCRECREPSRERPGC